MSYNISVDPITELVPLMHNTWQVVGSYNTLYNVSIEATICEKYSKTTNIIIGQLRVCVHEINCLSHTIFLATCGLLTKKSLGISDPMLKIGARNPVAIAGDRVIFYCPSGELIGLNRTTCQTNGNWEPDPMANEITCKQVSNTGKVC